MLKLELMEELVKWIEQRQIEYIEEKKKVLAQKQAKQLTSSKVWTEKAQNTDYEVNKEKKEKIEECK